MLAEPAHAALVAELMAARREIARAAEDAERLRALRGRVDAAKRALGERGPVWWADGAPDLNRRLAKTTPYAGWAAAMARGAERGASSASTPPARTPSTNTPSTSTTPPHSRSASGR